MLLQLFARRVHVVQLSKTNDSQISVGRHGLFGRSRGLRTSLRRLPEVAEFAEMRLELWWCSSQRKTLVQILYAPLLSTRQNQAPWRRFCCQTVGIPGLG